MRAQLKRNQDVLATGADDDDRRIVTQARRNRHCTNCHIDLKKAKDSTGEKHDRSKCEPCKQFATCPSDYLDGHEAEKLARKTDLLQQRIAEEEKRQIQRAAEKRKAAEEKKAAADDKARKRATGRVNNRALAEFLHATATATATTDSATATAPASLGMPLSLDRAKEAVRRFGDSNLAPSKKQRTDDDKSDQQSSSSSAPHPPPPPPAAARASAAAAAPVMIPQVLTEELRAKVLQAALKLTPEKLAAIGLL